MIKLLETLIKILAKLTRFIFYALVYALVLSFIGLVLWFIGELYDVLHIKLYIIHYIRILLEYRSV